MYSPVILSHHLLIDGGLIVLQKRLSSLIENNFESKSAITLNNLGEQQKQMGWISRACQQLIQEKLQVCLLLRY